MGFSYQNSVKMMKPHESPPSHCQFSKHLLRVGHMWGSRWIQQVLPGSWLPDCRSHGTAGLPQGQRESYSQANIRIHPWG